jgi:preprotein translocase subunit YajC
MSFFISSAFAQTSTTQAQQANPLITIVMFGGLFAFMYFFIIRPQRKRQKEHQNLVSALSKGDEVVMTSGMLGKIIKVDDSYVVIETGNNIELKFQKIAVHAVLPKGTIKSIDAA